MSKSQSARLLLIVTNLVLVLAIAALGGWAMVRGAYVDGARPSDTFSPVAYAMERGDRGRSGMRVVWQQLGRQRPPVLLDAETAKVLQVPQVEVVLVSIDLDDPDKSVGIVENALGVQEVVQVGQRLGEQTVKRIEVVDDGGVRRASIVFEGGGDVGFDRELEPTDRSR